MALRDNSTNVRITATDETRGALASAQAGLSGLGDAADNAGTRMAGMLAGGAVIGGLALLGNEVRKAIGDFDAMSKEAQRLGIGIENLSRLTFAAKLNDVGAAELSIGLAQLSKNLAETPEKVEALGIATKDAQGNLRSTDSVLSDIADSFANVRDGTEKTAAAMELFGKSGKTLIPLLNAGSEGLREMGDEADRFGITISEEAAKNAVIFNDNMTRLAASAKGLGYSIANELLPPLAALSDLLVKEIINPAGMEDPKASTFATWFNELSNSVDRARVSLFEFLGADKLAAKARADLAAGQGRVDTLATNSLIAFAEEGESQFAADTAGSAEKGTLANIAGVGKAKAGRKEKEPAFFSGVDLTDTPEDLDLKILEMTWDARIALEAEKEAELGAAIFEAELDREEKHRQHLLRMGDAATVAAESRKQFENMTETQKTEHMMSQIAARLQGVATTSKALFNIHKVAAISEAVMSLPKGVQLTLDSYPWPWNLAAGAAHLAGGLANIAKIKSATFGGSSSASTIAGGSAAPVFNAGGHGDSFLNSAPPVVQRAEAEAPRRQVNLTLIGDSFNYETVVEKIIPYLKEASSNGYDVVVASA